jgi:hypothetical protein
MDIALSRRLEPATLQACLSGLLPGLVVDVADAWAAPRPACDVVVVMCDNPSEFPCGLLVGVGLVDASGAAAWLRELARRLSIELGCRAVCDGAGLGDDASPYWSVVWDSGVAYLADDLATLLADGDGGPVVVRRPLPELGARPVDLVASVRRHEG